MQALYTAGAKEYMREKLKKVFLPVTAVLSSFLMCNCTFMQGFSPLGIAFLSAFDESLFMYSLMGTAGGYFFFLMGRNSLRYLAAVLLFMGLRGLKKVLAEKNHPELSAVLCTISLLFTGIVTILGGGELSDYVLVIAEAVLGGAAGFIFSGGIKAIENKSGLTGVGGLCIAFVLSALYMSSAGFTVFFIRPARIAAVALVLYSIFYMGTAPALVAALSAGMAGYLMGDAGALTYFALSALAGCAFAPTGKLFCSFGFLGAAIMGGFLGGNTMKLVPLFLETVAGISISLLLSPQLARRAGLLKGDEKESGELYKRAACQRIAGTADALFEISDITGAVSREMEKVYGEPLEKYIGNAINSACKSCAKSPACWQRSYTRSMDTISQLFCEAKAGNTISPQFLIEEIGCEKPETMVNFIEREARKYRDFKSARGKSYNLKSVACDQFEGMAQLLRTVSQDALRLQSFSQRENRDIKEVLLREGGIAESLLAVLDGENITISAEFPAFKIKRFNFEAVTDALSESAKRSLSPPFETKIGEDKIRLCWHAYPNLKVDWDFLQKSANNARLCGDSVASADTPDGNPIFLIADGMGAGGAAAVDSTMTTALLSRLLTAGSSFEGALKIVNASLISSGDERLCTVDGAILDLITGEVNIYKAGAAPSFVIRGGRLCQVEKSALPAGILGGAQAAKSTFSLKEGDILLMVSDGITESGTKWIPSQLQSLGSLSPQKICEGIIETAKIRNLTDRNDDMTVVAVKIEKADK